MKIRDLWLAWAAMIAAALFGMVMAGPARAQHWHGGMRGGFHGPVMARPMVGGWHGGGYYRPGWRGGWGPGAAVGGLAAGIVGGLAAGAMAQPYYNNPCWRWDGLTGWYWVC